MNKQDLPNDSKGADETLNSELKKDIEKDIAINKEKTFRHPLMSNKEPDYVVQAREEIKIDKELGLDNQAVKTAEAVLEKDIDELTNSMDYYQIDDKIIDKLFDLPKFRRALFVQNAVNHIKATVSAQKSMIICLLSALTVLTLGIFICNAGTQNGAITNIYAFVFGIIGIVSSIGFGICGLASFLSNNGSYKYETANVGLKIEGISSTDIRIPYGAKLKTLEAMKSGIFEKFEIITPQFSVNNKIVQIKKHLDPAIVGLTMDNRMFMICYWDIEHDKEKVMKDIKKYKKLKIKSI